jgi:ribonuclease-3
MTLNNTFGVFVYDKTITKAEASLQEIFTNHELIVELQAKIGHQFNEINHLVNAVTHRSFVHEYTESKRQSYERLEFLGDSVLGSYISYILFKKFENEAEGKLSKLRSALVNERSLAELGRYIGAHKCLLLGRGELQAELTDSIICDVFEAVLGAVTLDASIHRTYEVLEFIISNFEKENSQEFFSEKKLYLFDPKTTLQELTMKQYKSLPIYEAHQIEGGFKVELIIDSKKVCELSGTSKKQVQKELALKYLNSISK